VENDDNLAEIAVNKYINLWIGSYLWAASFLSLK